MLLDWLIGHQRETPAEPIRLDFKCGDYIINPQPILLIETERSHAKSSAADTLCPNCAPQMWSGFERDGLMIEMRKALILSKR